MTIVTGKPREINAGCSTGQVQIRDTDTTSVKVGTFQQTPSLAVKNRKSIDPGLQVHCPEPEQTRIRIGEYFN